MEDVEFSEDGILGQMDWNDFFDEFPNGSNSLEIELPALKESSSFGTLSNSSPDSWISQIENLLMQDDEDKPCSLPSEDCCDSFLANVLVDSRAGESSVVDPAIDVDSNASDCVDVFNNSQKEEVDAAKMDDGVGTDADDPTSKKRRRQMRNRDAAVRSRERKKMYVKDLEIKSKFLEGECRRLGHLLQCYYAENQALRFSLQMGRASGASLAKQESAVLLLESLLLGSLLWVVGIVCLFSPQLTVEPVPRVNMAEEGPGSAPLIRGGNNNTLIQSFLQTRKCKAAKSRMKAIILEARA